MVYSLSLFYFGKSIRYWTFSFLSFLFVILFLRNLSVASFYLSVAIESAVGISIVVGIKAVLSFERCGTDFGNRINRNEANSLTLEDKE